MLGRFSSVVMVVPFLRVGSARSQPGGTHRQCPSQARHRSPTYSSVVPPASGLFEAINDFAISTPWLHGPMEAFATYGIVLFAALVVLGWWLARDRDSRTMAAALITPGAAIVALAIQQVVVRLVDEGRPYALLPDTLVLIARTTDPSFPSDHACVTGAVAAGLFFVDRRLGWTTAAAALVMAVARVYVGAHWPLDVVAGLAVGAGISILLMLVLRPPVAGLVRRMRSSRLHPLLASPAT